MKNQIFHELSFQKVSQRAHEEKYERVRASSDAADEVLNKSSCFIYRSGKRYNKMTTNEEHKQE